MHFILCDARPLVQSQAGLAHTVTIGHQSFRYGVAVFAQHGWGVGVHTHELAQYPRRAWYVADAQGLEHIQTRIVE